MKRAYFDKEKVPPYLLPIYIIIEKSFGIAISQHQYEGMIVFLYDYMSLWNIGKLLSYFINKHETMITADIDKYHDADKANYNDIKEQLDKNGFAQWASTFDFQVNNSFIENEVLYVEGRFIEGQIIRIGDKIHSIKTTDKKEVSNMEVVSIEMYNKHVEFLDVGMTARFGLRTDKTYELKDDTILSSEIINGYE